MVYPHLDLFIVSLICGIWLILTHGFALVQPRPVQSWLRKFPRSKPVGAVLLIVDAVWSFMLLATMDLGEFSNMRTILLVAVIVATVLTFMYVDEFLAVRALGIFMLLLAEPLIESAFLRPETGRLLLVVWAYVLAVLGMLWVGMPYKLRDMIDFFRNSKPAWTAAAAAGVVYGGLLAAFGLMR